MQNKKEVKVVDVVSEKLVFSDGSTLESYHESDCCEHHWLFMDDVKKENAFDGLLFDLSDIDNLITKIPDFGISINPVNGYPVKIPGYGSNNGYYSTNLSVIVDNKTLCIKTEIDITECQSIDE